MESEEGSQPTQQATQAYHDPRRIGKQNSGFTDEEIADIICILYPKTESARLAARGLERDNSKHLAQRPDGDSEVEYLFNDDPTNFSPATAVSSKHLIILRLSVDTKDPRQGFTFGRHPNRCDICLGNDPLKRLSNIHFRIFVNEYGVLMLEDTSTNGTVVDNVLLKKANTNRPETKRTLSNGSEIKILLHQDTSDMVFIVQVPKREGEYDAQFQRNILMYRQRIEALENAGGPTRAPQVPEQPPNLFKDPPVPNQPRPIARPNQLEYEKLPREWNGSDEYNRVAAIGKGAFAVVHKVTSRYDGRPYAAKELDKRRFMKNGVLDQKVENEMKIMRSISHANIVRYIKHFEWDNRLLIIIMEYVPLGDLNNFVVNYGPLPEHYATKTAEQLVDALGYLHSKNITHRDVKPDNILIQSREPWTVKLTDFGLSKMIDNDQTFLRTFCGTLLYCAPEVYSEYPEFDEWGFRHPRQHPRRPTQGQRYDHAVDLYSLGGVLYYTLTGKPPFPATNGMGYTALLQSIMSQPLNTAPLEAVNLSGNGIDCLKWMLYRRPEHRATVVDVQNHAWLGGSIVAFSSVDTSSEELGKKASQLSLNDDTEHYNTEQMAPLSDDEILDEDDHMTLDNAYNEAWSQKENNHPTFGHPDQQRLFGEVNVSAIGSSGIIPADRLNLEMSGSVRDSFSSEYTEDARQGGTVRGMNPSTEEANRDAFGRNYANTDSALIKIPFPEDYGGANFDDPKSAATSQFRVDSDFNTSKRKPPSYDTSDEMDPRLAATKPSFKRLRSGAVDLVEGEDSIDNALIASVPPIARMPSGRQMDQPVSKTVFWAPHDRGTWHLKYPEMTMLQHGAFMSAAATRSEQFSPGLSPLWDLAMRYFPPIDRSLLDTQSNSVVTVRKLNRVGSGDDARVRNYPHRAAGLVVPVAGAVPEKRLVASLQSASDSAVTDISVHVRETFASFGRAEDNTNVYEKRKEVKVPKYAFKILLWKPGFEPCRNFRPWDVRDANTTHFYMATKATSGIQVNGLLVASSEPKSPQSPCRNWVRLYDGDSVRIWGDDVNFTKLVFRCAWGGSSGRRTLEDAATLVPDADAARLDEACAKAERRFPQLLEDDRLKAAERREHAQRELEVEQERDKSGAFEARRVEACIALGLLPPGRDGAASAPPTEFDSQMPPTQPPGRGWRDRTASRSPDTVSGHPPGPSRGHTGLRAGWTQH